MKHEEHLKTIAAGTGIALIGILFGRIVSYITRIFIARFTGPEEYGLLSLGLAIADIMVIISVLGMGIAISSMISYYSGKNDLGRVKGSILSSIKIALPLSIILSIALFLSSEYIALTFFHNPTLATIVKILAIVIPGLVLMELFTGVFSGFKIIKYKVYSLDIVRNVSMLGFVLLFAFLGTGIIGITIGWALGIAAGALVAAYYFFRIPYKNIRSIKSNPVVRELVAFSWPLMMVSFLALTLKWTDTLMLGYFGSTADVGTYNTAIITADIPRTLILSLGMIFIPVISGLYSRRNFNQIGKIYKIVTKWIFSLTIPIFAALILFSQFIITFLFGSEYISGSLALVVLSIGFSISTLFEVSTKTLVAIQKTKINLMASALAVVTNIILNLILIPQYGIVGAAIGTTISLILWGIISMIFIYRYMKTQPFNTQYLKPIIASLISIISVYYTIKTFQITSPILIIGMIGLSFILYGLINLLMKGFNREDVIVLKMIEERSGIRIEWLRNFIKRFV